MTKWGRRQGWSENRERVEYGHGDKEEMEKKRGRWNGKREGVEW